MMKKRAQPLKSQFTQNSVHLLERSLEYQHLERVKGHDKMYTLFWLLGILSLVFFVYFEFVIGLGTQSKLENYLGSLVRTVPPWAGLLATSVMVGLVLPWCCLALWSGWDRPLVPEGVPRVCFAFTITFLSLSLLPIGAFHSPPFILTFPNMLQIKSWSSFAATLALRVVPLLSPMFLGYVFYVNKSRNFKKVLLFPFPLLTVPLLFGALSFIWWRYSAIAMNHSKESVRGETLSEQIIDFVVLFGTSFSRTLVADAEFLVRLAMEDPAQLLTFCQPAVLVSAFSSAMVFSVVLLLSYFFFAPLLPFALSIVVGILPTNPHKWIACMLALGFYGAYLGQTGGLTIVLASVIGGLMLLLVFNGFES